MNTEDGIESGVQSNVTIALFPYPVSFTLSRSLPGLSPLPCPPGPAKGKCNSTVSKEYDNGANWCGQGCGFELCAQPGVTTESDLKSYLDTFTGGKGGEWLGNYTINDY